MIGEKEKGAISLFTLILIILTFISLVGDGFNDVVSNIIGSVIGGIVAIRYAIYGIYRNQVNRAWDSAISLLNLMDEFPDLIPEESLINELTAKQDSFIDFDVLYNDLADFREQLHDAVDKVETEIIKTNENINFRKVCKQVNVLQYDLRILMGYVNQYNKEKKIDTLYRIQRSKNKVIAQSSVLIEQLNDLMSTENNFKKSNVNFQDVANNLSNYNSGQEPILQIIQKCLKDGQASAANETMQQKCNENSAYGDELKWYSLAKLMNDEKIKLKLQDAINSNNISLHDITSQYNNDGNDWKDIVRQEVKNNALLGKLKYCKESNRIYISL